MPIRARQAPPDRIDHLRDRSRVGDSDSRIGSRAVGAANHGRDRPPSVGMASLFRRHELFHRLSTVRPLGVLGPVGTVRRLPRLAEQAMLKVRREPDPPLLSAAKCPLWVESGP
jgi:hypothetical protein